MNTTPLPEEETKSTRGRGRGRPTTESAATVSEADNVSDETQVSICDALPIIGILTTMKVFDSEASSKTSKLWGVD